MNKVAKCEICECELDWVKILEEMLTCTDCLSETHEDIYGKEELDMESN